MINVLLLRTNLTTIFLIAVLAIALTLSIPVIFPEMLHGFHMAHILLHTGGMILSLFITILAVHSYRLIRSRRLLLTSIAFGNFVFTETLLLTNALNSGIINSKDIHISEVGHLLMFVTLGLLALGVLRND